MNRFLVAATVAVAFPLTAWAQQAAVSTENTYQTPGGPVIERTESVVYEKRITEKRLVQPAGNPVFQPGSPTPTAAVTTVSEVEPTASVQLIPPPVTAPLAPPANIRETFESEREMRALRMLVEAQSQKIDNLEYEIRRQKDEQKLGLAQPEKQKAAKALKRDNVSIGVYAGPNLSRYSTDDDSLESKARVGYQLGLYVRGGGRLFGQLGVEYVGISSKLYSKDDQGTSINQISSTINTHYIQVPVQIGFRPVMSDSKRTGIRLQAGAELSYLLDSGKNDFKLTDDDYNKTVVNLLGGVGFDLGPVTLDVAYHHGIRDVYKNENAKVRMVSASLGFKF